MVDYKKTLHLPETAFPMKANLTQREPEMLRHWEETNTYSAMLDASGENGQYVLHDGPPYVQWAGRDNPSRAHIRPVHPACCAT